MISHVVIVSLCGSYLSDKKLVLCVCVCVCKACLA